MTRKSLAWFIPALAKSNVGSSNGIVGDDATKVWSFERKKLKYSSRTLAADHGPFGVVVDISLVVVVVGSLQIRQGWWTLNLKMRIDERSDIDSEVSRGRRNKRGVRVATSFL